MTGASPTTAQGTSWAPPPAEVCSQSSQWSPRPGCSEMYNFALSMMSREHPRKQIARSSTKSALKMSLAIQEGSSLIFSPKHVTARAPPVGTPSSGYNSSESVVPILIWVGRSLRYSDTKQAVCLWGQSCKGFRWCLIARLSHRLSPSQRRDQLPVASEQRHSGDIFQGSPGGRSC